MARALKVAVQMDPIETINIDGDSSFALMLAAQKRGHALWHYEVRDLALREGVLKAGAEREQRLFARARPVTVQRVRNDHYRFGPPGLLDLATMDVVLMRQDPPFDMAYITATHLLEHIHRDDGPDAGGEQPGRGAQRAGEAAGDPFPRPDAADPDHLGRRGHPRLPRHPQGHHGQAAVRQRRRRGVPDPPRRPQPRTRCWRCTSPARASR